MQPVEQETGSGESAPRSRAGQRRTLALLGLSGLLLLLTIFAFRPIRDTAPSPPQRAEAEVPTKDPTHETKPVPPPVVTPSMVEKEPIVPRPAPTAPTGIAGVVRADGEPLAGARVRAVDATGGVLTGDRGLKTGEDGKFSLPGAELEFPVELRVGKLSYEVTTVEVPRAVENLVIELSRGLSITGVIIDEEGNPVRAAVGALKLDDAGRLIPRRGTDPGIWAKTDDQGRWELTGLPPGRYEVDYGGVKFRHVDRSSVVCSAGDRNVVVVVHRACALHLVLLDEAARTAPIGKFTIILTDREAKSRRIDVGKGDARIVLYGLPADVYSVRVMGTRYETADLRGVRLQRFDEVETVQIPLTRRGSWGLGEVEIRIAWPDGSPAGERAEPLFVRIVPDDREVSSTNWPPIDAAAGKTTTLSDVPTGRYRVYAWSKDGEWVSPPRRVDVVEGESAAATLAVEAGGTLLPKLPRPESLAKIGEFRLTDSRGVRLAVAWLDLVPTTLSALGPLPAGLVRVELLSDGSPVATGEVVVEPGRRTEVLLR